MLTIYCSNHCIISLSWLSLANWIFDGCDTDFWPCGKKRESDKRMEWEENKDLASQSQLLNSGHLSQGPVSHSYWFQICSGNQNRGPVKARPPASTSTLCSLVPGCCYYSQLSVSSSHYSTRSLPHTPVSSWKLESSMQNHGLGSGLNSVTHSLQDTGLSSLVCKRGIIYLTHGASMTVPWVSDPWQALNKWCPFNCGHFSSKISSHHIYSPWICGWFD